MRNDPRQQAVPLSNRPHTLMLAIARRVLKVLLKCDFRNEPQQTRRFERATPFVARLRFPAVSVACHPYPEYTHGFAQALRLVGHCLRCRRRLFDQRRILLRHFVHLTNSKADLLDAGALL